MTSSAPFWRIEKPRIGASYRPAGCSGIDMEPVLSGEGSAVSMATEPFHSQAAG